MCSLASAAVGARDDNAACQESGASCGPRVALPGSVRLALSALIVGHPPVGNGADMPEEWRDVVDRVANAPLDDRTDVLLEEIGSMPSLDAHATIGAILADRPGASGPMEEESVAQLPKPALFPVDALPSAFARYVHEAAESLCCPPELLGVPLLSITGAAIGTTRPHRDQTWLD
jgi:hypothetical protein